ncbi:MAG: TDT family transporter [Eubacterium sp.]|nr:TDT family transporter [Eubacterium sp.]
MFKRIAKIPVPAVPTTLSVLTLANVYGGLGFGEFRKVIMVIGTAFLLVYLLKIICFSDVFIKEYKDMRNASLYAAFTMCWMILGSFYYEMGLGFGKVIWLIAVIVHLAHLALFIYRFMIRNRSWDNTLPCWFVTVNGIMVSCVTGGAMNMKGLLIPITIWGIGIYLVCLPIMIYRLTHFPITKPIDHRRAILLAPVSLCIVSIVNVFGGKPVWLMVLMLILYLATIAFIVFKLPHFFHYKFFPGFAGLTFPTAIGAVAAGKAAASFTELGWGRLGAFLVQFQGFMIFLATMLAGYVVLKFIAMAFKVQDEA